MYFWIQPISPKNLLQDSYYIYKWLSIVKNSKKNLFNYFKSLHVYYHPYLKIVTLYSNYFAKIEFLSSHWLSSTAYSQAVYWLFTSPLSPSRCYLIVNVLNYGKACSDTEWFVLFRLLNNAIASSVSPFGINSSIPLASPPTEEFFFPRIFSNKYMTAIWNFIFDRKEITLKYYVVI